MSKLKALVSFRSFSFITLYLLLATCQPPQSQQGSRTLQNSTNTTEETDTTSVIFRLYPQVVVPWQRFNKDGNYRLARFSDFRFSSEAIGRMSHYDNLWRQKLDEPYIFGDITRLGRPSDLAMIVIDQTTEDPHQKFGLIVFSAKSDGSLSDAKWVLRDSSLSTSTLGWSRNWPAVFKYAEHGNVERLLINWHARTDTYSVEQEQIGVDSRNHEGP